ncbi:RNA-binding domain-containing protein, partial [Stereum hirsutum FP-91666 SS1]|uniref:RNA-binding domain-containing protein n=1 Tax=Stereum hirsutum (strain FP-91666) TaxID=721885 RepID=UPI000440D86F
NPGNNLHVSGLATRVDTRDLEAAFGKIGRVQKASVMLDPHTRESRGFGFVTMETAEEADAAITALNAVEFMGKVMNVEKVCVLVFLLPTPPLIIFVFWLCSQARRGRARTPTPGRYYGPPKRHEREY